MSTGQENRVMIGDAIKSALDLSKCNAKRCRTESAAFSREAKKVAGKSIQTFEELGKLTKQYTAQKITAAQYTKQAKDLQGQMQQFNDDIFATVASKALNECSLRECERHNRDVLRSTGKLVAARCNDGKKQAVCDTAKLINTTLAKKTIDAETLAHVSKQMRRLPSM